jgi:NADH dehydrogenase [ubiquinone] 1 alpha subcomplex assembly factor 7
MPGLSERLIAQIRATGPISVADFMATCLLDPEAGYYTTTQPFGAKGDFTTAPEISQMFGELLGLCLAQAWVDQGRPTPFSLAELGPGRGTLMADLLRATRAVPGFGEAAQIWLVEASPQLRAIQRETLGGTDAHWASDVNDLPDQPLFLIANEFFDALPIRQFQRTHNAWSERMVGLDGGALAFGLAPSTPVAVLDHRLGDTVPGKMVETCAPARAIATGIGARIATWGGAALIVDYGNWRSRGDTLQAVSNHAYADPLADPGRADLTAHVDFEALGQALAPAKVSSMTDQGVLLARLGITPRAEALAQGLSGSALDQHHAAFHRLTDPAQMGTLFKAISAVPDGAPHLAGFDL